MKFKVLRKSKKSRARTGVITLNSGLEIKTPVFMPVGTQATVKTLTSEEVKEIGFNMILANTYHLLIRPGLEVIKKAGGLHLFMNWDKGILTDSGGFQVFSLSSLRKMADEGVSFRSHVDGKEIFLTPEKAIDAQIVFGSDIVMSLDECIAHSASKKETLKALKRTTLWAEKGLKYFNAHKKKHQTLFGIVQGGFYKDLRKQSAEELISMDFGGYAVGGLSVGETYKKTFNILDSIIDMLPKDKPRYFMGLGTIEQIMEAVNMGVDMFDCVLPTRNARNGQVFTLKGKKQLRNAQFKFSSDPIDKKCSCSVCRNYSLSYLHHLFNVKEILAFKLATYHNLYFLNSMIKEIRDKI